MILAVIDTNVIVASLLTHNHDSATARVMDAVYSGKVIPLVTGNMRHYPQSDFIVTPAEF